MCLVHYLLLEIRLSEMPVHQTSIATKRQPYFPVETPESPEMREQPHELPLIELRRMNERPAATHTHPHLALVVNELVQTSRPRKEQIAPRIATPTVIYQIKRSALDLSTQAYVPAPHRAAQILDARTYGRGFPSYCLAVHFP